MKKCLKMKSYRDFTYFQIKNYQLSMIACYMSVFFKFTFWDILKKTLTYILSRTNRDAKKSQTHQQTVGELAKTVEGIWNKADCCPYSRKHIVTLFEKNVWDKYYFLMREKHLPGDENIIKRSHKKDPSKHKDRGEPTRKSRRIQSTIPSPTVQEFKSNDTGTPDTSTMTRSKISLSSLRDMWDRYGKMLFDVKSQNRVDECSTKGLYFDESFYNDQKLERKMEMYLGKVTREYAEQEQQQQQHQTEM